MNGWEIIIAILGTNGAIELIKALVARRKTKADTEKVEADTGKVEADAAAVLIGSTVGLVKLKDELFTQLKAELTSELEAEREKRRKLATRLDTLDGEKKIYKSRLTLSKARMLSSNSKPVLETTSTNGWRGKTSC